MAMVNFFLNRGRLWCSTKTDGRDNYMPKEWGFCHQNCPAAIPEFPEMLPEPSAPSLVSLSSESPVKSSVKKRPGRPVESSSTRPLGRPVEKVVTRPGRKLEQCGTIDGEGRKFVMKVSLDCCTLRPGLINTNLLFTAWSLFFSVCVPLPV